VAQEAENNDSAANSSHTMPSEFLTGPVPNAALRSAAGPQRSVANAPSADSRVSMPGQVRTSVTSTASTRVFQAAAAAPLPLQQVPDQHAPVQPGTWHAEYSGHVDHVLYGDTCREPRGNVGDWWRQRLPHVAGQPGRLKASARDFINEHTLPPEHEYDIDVYDQRPISVASSQAVTTVQPLETNTEDAQAEVGSGKSELRTDIREIRPTLGYAMRNIKADQLPEGFNEKLDQGDYLARQSSPAVLQWAPTNLYHYPLYFEDPALERYGHTYHPIVQPFASAGRFATQLVGIPYQMTLHPVHSRDYTLGYYRPGECAPKKHYQIPFNEEAAIMQAAAMAGFFLIFP
jgi:hypothetical protein